MVGQISPGTLLGRYVVRSLLGKGAMGEVYEAKDSKIGRRVAIKVITSRLATDEGKVRRFETEAQAAGATNHPNLVTVYDVGIYESSPYLVSELLVGETLREQMNRGKLSPVLAIDYAKQIAEGLGAAHAMGIVHRDLKPENLFITKEGRLKILDFGLAKMLSSRNTTLVDTEAPTARPCTSPGMIIGTVGYMSPEQVRGENEIDHRSDIFAFGTVLYEMLAGRRAFNRGSAVETMNAILKEDPFEAGEPLVINPALERLIRHCLEKKREARFQSARDLAFSLEDLGELMRLDSSSKSVSLIQPNRSRLIAVVVGLILIAITFGYFLTRKRSAVQSMPMYHQVTFRRGTISSARFTADGQTIFYSAAWNGNNVGVFSTRLENPESRALGIENAEILAVSSNGEMAVLLNRSYLSHAVSGGTLARMPLFGGLPREILENVQQADWSPDGSSLAVVHQVGGQSQLEFPIGNVLYRTTGYISYLRVSPGGDAIAFFDCPTLRDNRGSVAVVDLKGNKRVLSAEWSDARGLAWSPSGDEIWFTASKAGETFALYSLTLSGRQQAVLRVPNSLMIQDISRDGHVLVTSFTESTAIIGLPPGETRERDLSWLDPSGLYDLSADGKAFIFQYYGEGSGTNYAAYLRRTDGSPAIRLGTGAAVSLSPDGRWVLAVLNDPRQISLLPTGPGEARRFDLDGIEDHGNYSWFPDAKHLLLTGKKPGQELGCYMLDFDSGELRMIRGNGTTSGLTSPDGKFFVGTNSQNKRMVYPIQGGDPRIIPGLEEDEEIIRWGLDGHSLFTYKHGMLPIRVNRIDLLSHRKEIWKEVAPSDPTGILGPPRILLSADGNSYVYQLHRHLSDLYVVEGLRP